MRSDPLKQTQPSEKHPQLRTQGSRLACSAINPAWLLQADHGHHQCHQSLQNQLSTGAFGKPGRSFLGVPKLECLPLRAWSGIPGVRLVRSSQPTVTPEPELGRELSQP